METKQQMRAEMKKRKEEFFISHTSQQLLALSNKILAKVEELPEFRTAEDLEALRVFPVGLANQADGKALGNQEPTEQSRSE